MNLITQNELTMSSRDFLNANDKTFVVENLNKDILRNNALMGYSKKSVVRLRECLKSAKKGGASCQPQK